MILQHFLTATARTDDQDLRQAMAVALTREIPNDSAGYERFHQSVVDVLQAPAELPVGTAHVPTNGSVTTAA